MPPNALTATVLRSRPGITAAPDRLGAPTPAVLVVGSWGIGLATVHDALSEPERRHHAERGVAAETVSLLFDADGTRRRGVRRTPRGRRRPRWCGRVPEPP
ncbi:hypothetical protein [Streptomyces sp. NPDC058632]|uniref:hypothetical protein n=1 Tax=unclassified Streptomyces TaxID=2593676 RepID=UPI00365419FE